MQPDLIVWAVAGMSVASFGAVAVWLGRRRAAAPVEPGRDCGLDDLMDVADVVHGHGCGIECDDVRLDGLLRVYGPMFAEQLPQVDWRRIAAEYDVPGGGGTA